MDIVENGKPSLVAVPEDFSEFELGMLERFKEHLGLTNTTSRKEILALEADLGFNLVTSHMSINNFSTVPSKLHVDVLTDLIEKTLKNKNKNIHKEPLSVENLYTLGKSSSNLFGFISRMFECVPNATLYTAMLQDKYTKLPDGSNLRDVPVYNVLLHREYWEGLAEDGYITPKAIEEITDYVSKHKLEELSESDLATYPVLSTLYNVGSLVISGDSDTVSDTDGRCYGKKPFEVIIPKLINKQLLNITLEFFIKEILFKSKVIQDNAILIRNILDKSITENNLSYACSWSIDIVDELTNVLKTFNYVGNDKLTNLYHGAEVKLIKLFLEHIK